MTIKTDLNTTKRKWVKEFRKTLNRKPKAIEVVIDDDSVYIYPTGTLSKHLGSIYNYGGIGAEPEENEELIPFQNKGKLLPYSKGH